MANVSDKEFAVAQVYGQAMFTLAEEKGEGDALLEELRDLAGYLDDHAEFDTFLSSPTIDTDARAASIEKVFRGRASDLLVDSLQVLNGKGRLGVLRSVVEAYRLAHEDRRGRVDVHVRTAVPLSEALRGRLQRAATRVAGKEAELIERVDDSMIGGMIVQIGDRKIDASVATRIRHLGEALHERASHEVHSDRSYVG